MIKLGIIYALCLGQAHFASAATQDQTTILKDVNHIAYGAALVKFCPVLAAGDYISFVQDLLMAERLITFRHGATYKHIKKQQEDLVFRQTSGGDDCDLNIVVKISEAEILMKKFTSTSALRDELPINHPEYPKLNQAFIFASYLQTRLARIYQRKCKILSGDALVEFNDLLLKTQYNLERVFRPEQVMALNKRMSERQYRAVLKRCDIWASFIEYAGDVMTDDIPDTLEILRQF
ncbi:MAG: hypothetical protein COB24_12705 [Hyphomicrobiales bacterium]|nr:MAG: hypothetical protein COB24_12705 [Hyphomicrobiales bacterium]